MRAQIKGLETASKNANDGISLVQTAEGALTEVHSMLNRMTELATQSANGTYDNEVDRANIAKEVESLKSEIDRIADSTNYNGINLLDGSLRGGKKVSGEANGEFEVVMIMGKTEMTAARTEATKNTATLVDPTGADDGSTATVKFAVGDKEYSVTMTAVTAANLTGENIAKALSGDTSSGLTTTSDNATTEALDIFKANFTVDAEKITAKEAGTSGAKITSYTGFEADGTTALTTTDITAKAAKEATYEITGTAGAVTADGELKIGEKTFTVATGEKFADLAIRLKKEGIDAEVDGQDLVITENDAIKAEQTGTGITTNNEALNIKGADATKANFSVEVSAGTAADATLTINYIDENGKEQAAEIKYTGAAVDADNNGAAIRAAIKDNEKLSNLFTVGGTGAEVTLETKVVGTGNAVIKGISTTDTVVTQKVVVTDAQDKGTEIKFGKDSLGKAGNFKNGDKVEVNGKTYEFTDGLKPVGSGNKAITLNATVEDNMKALQSALKEDGITVSTTGTGADTTLRIADFSPVSKIGGGLNLQVGDTSQTFNKVAVKIDSMGTENLGIKDINVGTQEGASEAMDKIKAAINQVSSTRGDLGAIQNRLEHTINNIGVAQENMTAAESRIRDVDMAKEMMNFTKNNILIQASQSMLAQANQLPQGVLQLLR